MNNYNVRIVVYGVKADSKDEIEQRLEEELRGISASVEVQHIVELDTNGEEN